MRVRPTGPIETPISAVTVLLPWLQPATLGQATRPARADRQRLRKGQCSLDQVYLSERRADDLRLPRFTGRPKARQSPLGRPVAAFSLLPHPRRSGGAHWAYQSL